MNKKFFDILWNLIFFVFLIWVFLYFFLKIQLDITEKEKIKNYVKTMHNSYKPIANNKKYDYTLNIKNKIYHHITTEKKNNIISLEKENIFIIESLFFNIKEPIIYNGEQNKIYVGISSHISDKYYFLTIIRYKDFYDKFESINYIYYFFIIGIITNMMLNLILFLILRKVGE